MSEVLLWLSVSGCLQLVLSKTISACSAFRALHSCRVMVEQIADTALFSTMVLLRKKHCASVLQIYIQVHMAATWYDRAVTVDANYTAAAQRLRMNPHFYLCWSSAKAYVCVYAETYFFNPFAQRHKNRILNSHRSNVWQRSRWRQNRVVLVVVSNT